MSSRHEGPEVGVVVAAYQAERWLGATLESLQAQTHRAWRAVVVDDGSRDGTAAVAEHYAAQDERITVVRRSNGGVAAARNTGFRLLPPDLSLVTFLDADDLYEVGGLARLVAALTARPDAVGVFGLAETCDEHGRPREPGAHPARQQDRRRWRGCSLVPLPPDADSTAADLIEYGPAWPSLVVLLRAAAVRAAGGFDEALAVAEDWDLHLRLVQQGPLAALDETVGRYRRHDANLTRGSLRGELATVAVRRKAFEAHTGGRPVQRRSAVRGNAVVLKRTAQRLRAHARSRDLRGVLRLLAVVSWSVWDGVLLRPPAPSRRRVWWSHGLAHDAPDSVWEG